MRSLGKRMCVAGLLTSIAWLPTAYGQSNELAVKSQNEAYRCEMGSAFRLFALEYPTNARGIGGCRVKYEKSELAAPARTLWRATQNLEFCIDRMRASVEKLVRAGWQCELQPVTFTDYETTEQWLTKPLPATQPQLASSKATLVELTKPEPEFDDWFHRWDPKSRGLVFTLSNTKDGRKARSFFYTHRALRPQAKQPGDIVLVDSQINGSILIVMWPAKRSIYITAIDPLRQDEPFCQLRASAANGGSWGYGFEDGSITLNGYQAIAGLPGQFEPVRRTCSLNPNESRTLARSETRLTTQ